MSWIELENDWLELDIFGEVHIYLKNPKRSFKFRLDDFKGVLVLLTIYIVLFTRTAGQRTSENLKYKN
jgi:hypothetical protein